MFKRRARSVQTDRAFVFQQGSDRNGKEVYDEILFGIDDRKNFGNNDFKCKK